MGRFVFAYERSEQARADLPGRRTLIDGGCSLGYLNRYREVAFVLVDASTDGQELVLDVAPVNDTPKHLFDPYISRTTQHRSFAMCPAFEPIPSGPLEPLGPTTSGGRIEMPGSGFAVGFPADWSVEVAERDPDFAQAQPGDAWEALRAYAPGRDQTCSVYVAVAMPGTTDMRIMTTPGLREPRWTDPAAEPVLEIPDPRDRVEDPSGFWSGASGDFDRFAADDPGLDHDVVYALHCAADVDTSYDSIYESFVLLPVE